jgi:hypothetical protein
LIDGEPRTRFLRPPERRGGAPGANGHVRRMRRSDPETWLCSPEPTTKRSSRGRAVHRRATWTWVPAATVRWSSGRASSGLACSAVPLQATACTARPAPDPAATTAALARARYPGIADTHSRDVLVAEQPIVIALDTWRAELFAPNQALETAQAIAEALDHEPNRSGEVAAARKHVRAARDAPTAAEPRSPRSRPTRGPPLARRSRHRTRSRAGSPRHRDVLAPPTTHCRRVLAVIEHHGGLEGALEGASTTDRAVFYNAMAVSAVFDSEGNKVRRCVDPVASTVCRRGDLNPHALAGTSPSS